MTGTTFAVVRKEISDGMRDRRTLLTISITALLMGPILLLLLGNFVTGYEQKSTLKQLYVDGIGYAPGFANFLARNGIQVLSAPSSYETQIRSGKLQQAVIAFSPDYRQRLRQGKTATVRVVFDASRNQVQPSIRRAEALLRAYSHETMLLRVMERGISPELLNVVEIDQVNTATPKQQGAFLMFLIPMFALIGAVVGSMSAAIDTTAGERERGSLEPLLMNPIDLRALVVGKWVAVAAQSCAVVMCTLASFALATHFVPSEKLRNLFQFGSAEFLRFCALMVPFACMVAALQMLVATYGRTYKEAQTYASYIALVINFVPLITIFAQLKDATWQLFIPALAQQMVLSRVLRGDAIGLPDYLLPLATAAALNIVFLVFLTRLLRREEIIFGR